jgi:uncharacterized protein YjgD (DUF1641 family)
MNAEDQILERLTQIEAKLDRVAALEERLSAFTGSWESMSDLGRDLSLLTNPTVKILIEELSEVETGFQIEDVLFLLKRLLLSFRNIAWTLEQLENLIDWWRDLEPVLKMAVPHFIDLLDDLERKGIFRINRAMIGMYAKIAEHYTAEDIEAIGDGFVRMHGLIKKLAEPGMVEFLEKFSALPGQLRLQDARPVGPVGLIFRLMNPECRQGLGVAVEMTRALGQVAAGNGKEGAAAQT